MFTNQVFRIFFVFLCSATFWATVFAETTVPKGTLVEEPLVSSGDLTNSVSAPEAQDENQVRMMKVRYRSDGGGTGDERNIDRCTNRCSILNDLGTLGEPFSTCKNRCLGFFPTAI